jgi:hypothetical protein
MTDDEEGILIEPLVKGSGGFWSFSDGMRNGIIVLWDWQGSQIPIIGSWPATPIPPDGGLIKSSRIPRRRIAPNA